MVKRSRVDLAAVAEFDNLAVAFWRAARGKRRQVEVARFAERLDANLSQLGEAIRTEAVRLGEASTFRIHDPKPRLIHAPCFRERVVHHALMAKIGPVLDRAMVDDSYACREGKGAHAAAKRAQQHLRRFPWYVKADVRSYFASIPHEQLHHALTRRLKDAGVLRLCARILAAHQIQPGRGLPIGALTSQHFANFYLSSLDRFLLEELNVCGMVRYQDDSVWWCRNKKEARRTASAARAFVQDALDLQFHDHLRLAPSRQGLAFVGFRITAGRMALSRRRRARYARARRLWEAAYVAGDIDASALQAGYAAAAAITAHADSTGWRRQQLARMPEVDA